MKKKRLFQFLHCFCVSLSLEGAGFNCTTPYISSFGPISIPCSARRRRRFGKQHFTVKSYIRRQGRSKKEVKKKSFLTHSDCFNPYALPVKTFRRIVSHLFRHQLLLILFPTYSLIVYLPILAGRIKKITFNTTIWNLCKSDSEFTSIDLLLFCCCHC